MGPNPKKKIVVTVPRRIAAITVASRVAHERGCALGTEVGYAVRFDDKTNPSETRLKFVTDGLLLKELLSDPLLANYSVVIVDDAHDRSLASDLLLGILKRILKVRSDLRVVISSATMDIEALANFFHPNWQHNFENDADVKDESGDGLRSNGVGRQRRWGYNDRGIRPLPWEGPRIYSGDSRPRDREMRDASVERLDPIPGTVTRIRDRDAPPYARAYRQGHPSGATRENSNQDTSNRFQIMHDNNNSNNNNNSDSFRIIHKKIMHDGNNNNNNKIDNDDKKNDNNDYWIMHKKIMHDTTTINNNNNNVSNLAVGSMCVMTIGGRTFPVSIFYTEEPVSNYVTAAVETAIEIHISNPVYNPHTPSKGDGDILIFLTGQDEVELAIDLLNQPHLDTLAPIPLYSQLPPDRQQLAFSPPFIPHKRRVIVSTNVAETAVTLPNVEFVVDSCLVKTKAMNPKNGISTLHVTPASRAACRQRAGRAGRVREGKCYRLLTEQDFYTLLPSATPPEIMRLDLTSALLYLKCLGVESLPAFELLSPPTSEAFLIALENLHCLGAIDDQGKLVRPYGDFLAALPLEPQWNRMLLLAEKLGCLEEAILVASGFSASNAGFPFLTGGSVASRSNQAMLGKLSFAAAEGDIVSMCNLQRQFEKFGLRDLEWCRRHSLNRMVLLNSRDIADQLRAIMLDIVKDGEGSLSSCGVDCIPLLKAACGAFFYNAARKRSSMGGYELLRDVRDDEKVVMGIGGGSLLSGSGALHPEWVVFVEAFDGGHGVQMTGVSVIDLDWLPELAGHYYKSREKIVREAFSGKNK